MHFNALLKNYSSGNIIIKMLFTVIIDKLRELAIKSVYQTGL